VPAKEHRVEETVTELIDKAIYGNEFTRNEIFAVG